MATAHGTPSRQQPHAASAPAASGNSDGDVWIELFGTVKGLEEAVDLCMQAFGPDPVDKVSSKAEGELHGVWEGRKCLILSFDALPAQFSRRAIFTHTANVGHHQEAPAH